MYPTQGPTRQPTTALRCSRHLPRQHHHPLHCHPCAACPVACQTHCSCIAHVSGGAPAPLPGREDDPVPAHIPLTLTCAQHAREPAHTLSHAPRTFRHLVGQHPGCPKLLVHHPGSVPGPVTCPHAQRMHPHAKWCAHAFTHTLDTIPMMPRPSKTASMPHPLIACLPSMLPAVPSFCTACQPIWATRPVICNGEHGNVNPL